MLLNISAMHSNKKSRYKASKKSRFLEKLKKYAYNIFTVVVFLGMIVFAYILFYSLLFEPLFLSKAYGASDTHEVMYLAVVGFVIGVSYIFRNRIQYTGVQPWQKNLRLLQDVKFNLERYSTLKGLGIDHISKQKRKKRHSNSASTKKSN